MYIYTHIYLHVYIYSHLRLPGPGGNGRVHQQLSMRSTLAACTVNIKEQKVDAKKSHAGPVKEPRSQAREQLEPVQKVYKGWAVQLVLADESWLSEFAEAHGSQYKGSVGWRHHAIGQSVRTTWTTWTTWTTQIQGRSDPLSFLHFCFCETSSRLQPRANSSGLIFQKCSEHGSYLKNILAVWSANRALNMVSCTFCQQLSLIEARAPWKQRPYFRDPRSHHTRKNTAFAPESVFTRDFTRFRTFQLLNDGWLTWWCGRHDGVNANHDHHPQLGSLLTKRPFDDGGYNNPTNTTGGRNGTISLCGWYISPCSFQTPYPNL